SGVPTGTVCPSGTRTSSRTPSYGLGISESTLSVDTSNNGSSNATVSPTDFSQRLTVPSVTDSPSLGIEISCAGPGGADGAAAGGPAPGEGAAAGRAVAAIAPVGVVPGTAAGAS